MITETLNDINIKQAVQYCFDHPTIAMYAISVQFGVDISKLQHEYRKAYNERQKGTL